VEKFINEARVLLMPVFILTVGSMSKFLLWDNRKKTWKDFVVFVVFGLFLMIIITYLMNIFQEVFNFSNSLRENILPLLYAFSSLGSKEILEILIKKLPNQMANKILGGLNVVPEMKKT